MTLSGIVGSSLAGVAFIHMTCFFMNSPMTGAAWGWKLSPPSGAKFSCSEGTQVGGAAYCTTATPACTASDFDCTVTPNSGYSCDQTKISVKCAKTADGVKKSPIEANFLCINVGATGHPKDSDLSWSATPVCTSTEASHSERFAHFRWPLLTSVLVFGLWLGHPMA